MVITSLSAGPFCVNQQGSNGQPRVVALLPGKVEWDGNAVEWDGNAVECLLMDT